MAIKLTGEYHLQDEQATGLALQDPRVGDLFTEDCSYWVYVVYRSGDNVATLSISAEHHDNEDLTFPEDGKLERHTLAEFRKMLSYAAIPGYWVRLAGRGHDVAGWYERALFRERG